MDAPGLAENRCVERRLEGEHIAGMLAVQPWLEAHALEARLKLLCSALVLAGANTWRRAVVPLKTPRMGC
jgi:hypothetical protein